MTDEPDEIALTASQTVALQALVEQEQAVSAKQQSFDEMMRRIQDQRADVYRDIESAHNLPEQFLATRYYMLDARQKKLIRLRQ